MRAIVPVPKKKNPSASRSNFSKFQFSLSKVKENISIDFWHKQLDQKSLLFLFKVLCLSVITIPSFALLAFDWFVIEWNHPYIFCSEQFFPLLNFRAIRNCNQMIRWCVGEIWIGNDIVQMFSWVLGTGCWLSGQSTGLGSLLQLLIDWILSLVMVMLAAYSPSAGKTVGTKGWNYAFSRWIQLLENSYLLQAWVVS